MRSTLQHHIVVLIPARNESATVGYVVESVIQNTGWPVVVIDDASSDDTAAIAQEAGATVISLAKHVGAWHAIQSGMQYALANNVQCVITMDADGQHIADTLPCVHNALNNGSDVVIGSCPSRVSRKRRMGWMFFRALSGLQVKDLTSGLRVYNHSAMHILSSKQASRLEYQDIGVLMLLRSAGFRIKEIPVPMRDRLVGHSKIYASWRSIFLYMCKTTLICLQKKALKPAQPLAINAAIPNLPADSSAQV